MLVSTSIRIGTRPIIVMLVRPGEPPPVPRGLLETELSDRGGYPSRVGRRRVDEDVEILREPRPAVRGQRVRADEQEPDAMALQRVQKLVPFGLELHRTAGSWHAGSPRCQRSAPRSCDRASSEPRPPRRPQRWSASRSVSPTQHSKPRGGRRDPARRRGPSKPWRRSRSTAHAPTAARSWNVQPAEPVRRDKRGLQGAAMLSRPGAADRVHRRRLDRIQIDVRH